jgi:hypothetical protein
LKPRSRLYRGKAVYDQIKIWQRDVPVIKVGREIQDDGPCGKAKEYTPIVNGTLITAGIPASLNEKDPCPVSYLGIAGRDKFGVRIR